MYLVSACLLGINCRYDGGTKRNEALMRLASDGLVIPVCPEQLGGCATPRSRSEIAGGDGAGVLCGKCRVITNKGNDVTDYFVRGAEETLKLALLCGVKKAVLKARSPSCGLGRIYDGTFGGILKDGNGVTAELLSKNGIQIFSEENLEGLEK